MAVQNRNDQPERDLLSRLLLHLLSKKLLIIIVISLFALFLILYILISFLNSSPINATHTLDAKQFFPLNLIFILLITSLSILLLLLFYYVFIRIRRKIRVKKELDAIFLKTNSDFFQRLASRNIDKGQSTNLSPTNFISINIHITEEPLSALNLSTMLLSFIELYTKSWLIEQKRLDDLIEYTQTNDPRFVKEANLIIGRLSHNSPAWIELILNHASSIAEALKTAITFAQTPFQLEASRLANEAKSLDNEAKRLDNQQKRFDMTKDRLDYALETAEKMVGVLNPDADQETKKTAIQMLLPSLLKLDSTEGIELTLPAPQNEKEKTSTTGSYARLRSARVSRQSKYLRIKN